MKLLTGLLALLLIYIDIKLQIRNSILFIEVMGLIAFYIVINPIWRDYRRRQLCRKELKQTSNNYVSPKENKDWRKRSQTQVQVEKTDLFDRI